MATIQQSLRLYDGLSGPLRNINRTLHMVIDSFESMQAATGRAVDTSSFDSARRSLNAIDNNYKQIESSVDDVIRGQERLNNSLNEGSNIANRFGKILKAGVAGVISAKTINSVSDWLKGSMDLSDVQRNAEMQLKTVMQNVGMTQAAYEELKRTASGIQAKGIYGDEAMLGGAAEFATYLTDPQAIRSMMGTLSNYAMGMSGGGALDYNQMVDYATQLGKALNGSYDGLLKKGFTLTDQQKAIIENGSDMQKALMLDNVISESWNDLYQTMSNTPEGKIIQLQNAYGDLREEVGEKVYPAVSRIAQVFTDHFDTIERVVNGFASACKTLIYILGNVAEVGMTAADYLLDHWEMVIPTVLGVAAAFTAMQIAGGGGILAVVRLVVLLIGFIYSMAASIAKTTGIAQTGFGVIAGAVNVAIQFIVNLTKAIGSGLVKAFTFVGATATSIFNGIGNLLTGFDKALKAITSNIGTLFENGFHRALSAVYSFVSDSANRLLSLANLINSVLGIFDLQINTSGLESVVRSTAAAAEGHRSQIQSYKDVAAAFKAGMSTYGYTNPVQAAQSVGNWSYFANGWKDSAFQSGAAWGDSKMNQLTNAVNGILNYGSVPDSWTTRAVSGIKDAVDSIAGNTTDLRDTVGKSAEELKILREMAERSAVAQYTIHNVKVDMVNNNSINSEMDLDGIVRYLETTLEEAMYSTTEGVHI